MTQGQTAVYQSVDSASISTSRPISFSHIADNPSQRAILPFIIIHPSTYPFILPSSTFHHHLFIHLHSHPPSSSSIIHHSSIHPSTIHPSSSIHYPPSIFHHHLSSHPLSIINHPPSIIINSSFSYSSSLISIQIHHPV